jgi:hypothetical protein
MNSHISDDMFFLHRNPSFRIQLHEEPPFPLIPQQLYFIKQN